MLGQMAVGASWLAMGSAMGWASVVQAAPGSNPGKYKIDLGGYNGPELTSEPITLRFMRQDFAPSVNAVFDNAYAEFRKAYPNITIEEEKVPYGDLQKKVQVYVASGEGPDIMMGRNDFATAYAAGQFAVPLNQYFSQEFIDDIVDSLRNSGSVGGDLLCLPWETNPVFMYFNRDIFESAGIETPPEVSDITQGWTWDQFNDALDRLTKALRAKGDTTSWALAASTYGNGGPGSNYAQLESIWIRSMGDPNADKASSLYKTFAGVSEDGLTASGYLDTPEAVQGMKNYQFLFANGITPKGAGSQFREGIAGMMVGSINEANYMTSEDRASTPYANTPPFKFGTTPLPRGAMAFSAIIADAPFVYAGSPHVAEAAALLAFICNDANRLAFHKEWGSMPGRKSLLALDPRYSSDQSYQLAAAVAATAYAPPQTVGWFDYFNAVNPAVSDIALGADPQKRLTNAAQQVDGLLAKYK
ncbi:MAG: extracellular solute-binding protein [Candidatus Kaistia colombiensis]|nr:MAG: extracellular solute-binding protein [Kaistia sp.]